MRKVIGASMLALTLSCFTYAGNMPTPAPDPQVAPTPTASSTSEETADGYISNNQSTESTVLIATETVLSLLESMLSLF